MSDEMENIIRIRGKWIYTGCGSLEEMAERLEEKAEDHREKAEEGYRLISADPNADYWTLQKLPKEEREKLDAYHEEAD